MPDHLVRKPERQIGHGANVYVDDAELGRTIQIGGAAEQAEACIVDEVFDFDPLIRKNGGDPVAGAVLLKIAGNDDRICCAAGSEFISQRLQARGTTRHQRNAMPVHCKYSRQLAAYPRRGTGYQRHTLGHD
jgi:hypothetical protein